jgi:hypothetical protein
MTETDSKADVQETLIPNIITIKLSPSLQAELQEVFADNSPSELNWGFSVLLRLGIIKGLELESEMIPGSSYEPIPLDYERLFRIARGAWSVDE